jgi:hypothetical protein
MVETKNYQLTLESKKTKHVTLAKELRDIINETVPVTKPQVLEAILREKIRKVLPEELTMGSGASHFWISENVPICTIHDRVILITFENVYS